MKRNKSIDFLRFIACLLILNFHLDILFPNNISFLSFGGDIGNNMFFMLSGFLLFNNISKHKYQNFSEYYLFKIKRILPRALIFYLVSIFIKLVFNISNDCSFVELLLTSHFWFVEAILFLYIPFYFQTKYSNIKIDIGICILLFALHYIFDSIFVERYIIGYISMICGYYLNYLFNKNKYKKSYLVIVSLVFYIIVKVTYKYASNFREIIHLLIGISIVALCSTTILFLYNNEYLNASLEKNDLFNKLISMISSSTLEIYLLSQIGDRFIVKLFDAVYFPISYILCAIVVVGLGYISNYTFDKLWKK